MNAQQFNSLTDPQHPINALYRQQQEALDLALSTVEVNRLEEITSDGIGLINGNVGTRIDGMLVSKRLNAISLFSDILHTITLPANTFSEDNILHLEFEGHIFQETGSAQTLTPELYLGPAGDEMPIGSGVSLSVNSSSVQRGFTYSVRITHAPNLGNSVLVNERFLLESATAGSAQIISRTTISPVSTVTALDEIDTLIMSITNGAAATTFVIYSDTLNVWIEEGLRDEDVLNWYSQPTGSASYDNTINSGIPTTNQATAVTIAVGESNSDTLVRRTLIKFPDLANLADIIEQYDIEAAYLHLRIQGDFSGNTRVYDLWRLLVDWDLTTSTWNNSSAGTPWNTAGAGNSTLDYDGSAPVASVTMSASETVNTTKAFNLDVDILRGMIDGTYPNYGFLIKAQTETNDMYNFHSGDASTPSNAPILQIILRKR